jgi:hypothetical protein
MMAEDYTQKKRGENRVGLHYSTFSPFSKSASLENQSLEKKKFFQERSNPRIPARNQFIYAILTNMFLWGQGWHSSRVRTFFGLDTGGVASLNHRL